LSNFGLGVGALAGILVQPYLEVDFTAQRKGRALQTPVEGDAS
jgi:hypothetical protein